VKPRPSFGKTLALVLKVGVSVALLAYLLSSTDLAASGSGMRRAWATAQ